MAGKFIPVLVVCNAKKMILLLAGLTQFDLSALEEKLLPLLTAEDRQVYSHFVSEKRKKEWLAVRLLLRDYLGRVPQIKYDSHGRPFLKDFEGYLSISHSHDYAAVCLDRRPCAVDIDSLQRDYHKLSGRYLSPQEQVSFQGDSHKLALSWMAKEAMFKLMGRENVIFAEQLRVFIGQSISNFGYFYGEYLPTNTRVSFTYYRIKNNLIVLAQYE